MQCLTNINRFKIPNDVIISYLSLYKSIGKNHHNHDALNTDYQVMVRQTISHDVYYFAKIFDLSISESRLKSLIYKDIIPKNKDEKLVLQLKLAFIKIHNETSTFEIHTNEIFDLLRFLYKDIVNDKKLQFMKIEKNNKDSFSLLTSRMTSKRDKLDMMIELFTEKMEEGNFEASFIIGNFYIDFLNEKPFYDKNEEIALITLYILLLTNGYEVFEYISFMKVLYMNKPEFHDVVLLSSFNWAEGYAETLNLHRFLIKLSLYSYDQINLLIRDYEFDSQLNKSNNVENTIHKLDDVFSKDDIRNVHPYISDSTINRTLKRLRDEEKIRPLGKGRSAKWIKIVEMPKKKTIYEQLDLNL